jgi:VanZ family protein
MKLSRKAAWGLLVLLLLLLLLGTQMPGAWRDEAFRVSHLPWQMTKVAHCVVFAAMTCLARVAPLRWPVALVLAAALAMALLTEGLQHFAANRDPSWLDVGIDMAGAALGLLLALLAQAGRARF